MIPFDFEYYRPESLDEALCACTSLSAEGKTPVYYGGGTEIISMARAGSIKIGAVIDLKEVPECKTLAFFGGTLAIGSSVTLTQIAEANYFPLLSRVVSRIADHTIQCKITLGGNLAGSIIYREAALPLMLAECRAVIMGQSGLYEAPFSQVFDGRLKLKEGEFLVQVLIENSVLSLPHIHVKKTKNEKIDYPLMTVAATKKGGKIKAAVSGLSSVPFLLPDGAGLLNDFTLPENERIDNTAAAVSPQIMSDLNGGREYRQFVLKNILARMFENFKGA